MIELIIVAPSDDVTENAPIGFILVDEIFAQAGLKDTISSSQTMMGEMRRTLAYLINRFPRRIRVEWVEPLSLRGIYTKFRYRLRAYPVVLILSGSEAQIIAGEDIASLRQKIEELLSSPADTS